MSTQTREQLQAFPSQIEDLLRRLADAQASAEVEILASLLSPDFKLVGPLGFVVPREQWLHQFRSGSLQISALDWDELDVRTYVDGRSAIAIGRLDQQATYGGRPVNGAFRVTVIALHAGDRWLIAGMHYSALTPPADSPVPA
jgi:ketosteroid isomerase-like protein